MKEIEKKKRQNKVFDVLQDSMRDGPILEEDMWVASGSGRVRLTRSETCGRFCPWWASCPESDFGSAPTAPSRPGRRSLEESCRAPET